MHMRPVGEERDSPEVQRVIERANLSYRREWFFYLGIVAAVLNAVFRWPVRAPMAAALFFVAWAVSVLLYTEAYKALNKGASDVLGRLRDERKAKKCLLLLLLPFLFRAFGVLTILLWHWLAR